MALFEQLKPNSDGSGSGFFKSGSGSANKFGSETLLANSMVIRKWFFISAFCILSESLNSPTTGNEKMRLSCCCRQLGIEYLDNLLQVRFFRSRDSLFIFSTAG